MGSTQVDIITGMPIDYGYKAGSDASEKANDLLDKMQMVGLPQSLAAQTVASKVTEILEQRIAVILNTDPQAKTCLDILRAINAPAITAREAARRYTRRFNFLNPAPTDGTTPEKEELYP